MLAAIATAVCGLRAATLRREASASDVANIGSRGALPPGAPQAYQPVGVEQAGMASGGTLATVRDVSPAWRIAYDASASFADAAGIVAEPNVDLVGEALEQETAQVAFLANLRTLQAAQDMVRRLYELVD